MTLAAINELRSLARLLDVRRGVLSAMLCVTLLSVRDTAPFRLHDEAIHSLLLPQGAEGIGGARESVFVNDEE